MGKTLAYKILGSHLVDGNLRTGDKISIKIDQTLTQDATGTMAYLQFEAMGVARVKTEVSVSYVDHNTLQTGFENADDHKYLQTVAKKHGIYFSRPGNGICHQVHLERFAVPGRTLLGSDSHTPTAGGIGMIAIGAGGLDVAVAMGGGSFFLTAPKVTNIRLSGKLKPGVSAKDIILEVLRRLTVKGGVGRIMEYSGPGVSSLSVPERATITNMGAELGATTSIFPSDEVTLNFLKSQGRAASWVELSADPDAVYDEAIEIDLSQLGPLAAQPHSPDAVASVGQIGPIKIDQACIGSCTNSSLYDMMKVAAILRGRKVHPDVSLAISPGSRQVLEMLARNGALADIVSSGARILETACGPCIGMGQSPKSGGVSLRTFNRNFEGRTGTQDAKAFLVSPEVAAASALTGVLTDPGTIGEIASDLAQVKVSGGFLVDDSMILEPAPESETSAVEVLRGPNIKPLPVNTPLPPTVSGEALLVVGDNITTDHIMPAGSKILPLRSNIPAISKYVFAAVDSGFSERAAKVKEQGSAGFVIGGHNYGQGSSREHAALAPMHLGVKALIVKSFARIHKANLVNFGILPLTFDDEGDYGRISQGDSLELPDIARRLAEGGDIILVNKTKGENYKLQCDLSARDTRIILAGGLLNYTRTQA